MHQPKAMLKKSDRRELSIDVASINKRHLQETNPINYDMTVEGITEWQANFSSFE